MRDCLRRYTNNPTFLICVILLCGHLLYILLKMKVGRFLKSAVKMVDVFSTTEYLRYKGDPEYRTVTGGVTSLLIIVLFMALFFTEGLKTVNKEIIFSSESTVYETEPTLMKTTLNPRNGFMFGIFLVGYDLNLPNVTYFNLSVGQQIKTPAGTVNHEIPLQPCTQQHFRYNDEGDGERIFNSYQGSTWRCPPIDYQVEFRGRTVSEYFSQIVILLSMCNSTLDSTCVSNTTLTNQNFFSLSIPTIKTIINPGEKDYKQIYFEDLNYIVFSQSIVADSIMRVEQLHVETDQSLLPIQDKTIYKIPAFQDELLTQRSGSRFGTQLVQLRLQKSPAVTLYTRSFNKLDEFFSYVGGLVGTVLGVIFIMQIYSEKAFGVSIASRLYKGEDGQSINSDSFNFLYMLSMGIKTVVNFCGCDQQWPKTDMYLSCTEEMDQQLDITLILKKLIFLERAVDLLFKDHEIDVMHLAEQQSLIEAQESRQKYKVASKLRGQEGENEIKSDKQDAGGEVLVFNEFEGQIQDRANVSELQMERRIGKGQLQIQGQVNLSDSSDLSSNEIDSNRIKTNILKVAQDSRKGNPLSRRIIKQIRQDILPKVGLSELEREEQVRVRQKSQGESSEQSIVSEKKLEKQPENPSFFDYQIDNDQ